MKKYTKVQKSDFTFVFVGHGQYHVTYTSPNTGKKWSNRVNDMELIDATKNSPDPKLKDLKLLMYHCKNFF